QLRRRTNPAGPGGSDAAAGDGTGRILRAAGGNACNQRARAAAGADLAPEWRTAAGNGERERASRGRRYRGIEAARGLESRPPTGTISPDRRRHASAGFFGYAVRRGERRLRHSGRRAIG